MRSVRGCLQESPSIPGFVRRTCNGEPNQPLEPTAGGSWFVDSKLSSARRGSAARRLFGFSHRPDISIGNGGSAIEIKVITSGQSVRDVLGQGLAYRMHYRFVILVLIDQTEEPQIVNLCRVKGSRERSLLSELAEAMNIFTIIGPLRQSRNIIFTGKRQGKGNAGNAPAQSAPIARTSSAKVRAEQGAALDAGPKAIRTPGTSDQGTGPRK
jgi:hypothetical protein